jgi:hypothetical protein
MAISLSISKNPCVNLVKLACTFLEKKDYSRAHLLLEGAASQNNLTAIHILGIMSLRGQWHATKCLTSKEVL